MRPWIASVQNALVHHPREIPLRLACMQPRRSVVSGRQTGRMGAVPFLGGHIVVMAASLLFKGLQRFSFIMGLTALSRELEAIGLVRSLMIAAVTCVSRYVAVLVWVESMNIK